MSIISSLFTRQALISISLMLFILLLTLQFLRPEIKKRPITGDVPVPAEVKAIFKRACYDCHSNETKLGWGDQIVPVYWLVAKHVNKGRAHLNFSEWNEYSLADQKVKLWEAINHTLLGAMPRADYAFVHSNAKLSPTDISTLKKYLATLVDHKISDSGKIRSEENQYVQWLHDKNMTNLPVSLNGIRYDPDYKNWTPVSTSDRFESSTMRVIFGNDIAIMAVKNNQTRPWPDGASLAKALWTQIVDSTGKVRTGAFVQLDLMVKDKRKFASTGGWGFARFKTLKMIPYGKTAMFASECINCHRPMKNEDYVFTIPVRQ